MPSNVSHFAIHADDVARARSFYEQVFGWTFEAWGPPDFFLISTGPEADPGIHGSLQLRSEPAERGVLAYECTISVASVERTTADVVRHGGVIVTQGTEIPGVGRLIQFRDPERNLVSAMEYEEPRSFVDGIDHVQVAVPVGSEAQARAFYVGILGMEEIPKPQALAVRGGLWLRCGLQQLHIGVESAHVPARKAHPAFRIRRFDELLKRLEAAGVAVRRDEEIPGVRRVFCDDAAGNRLELIEVRRGPPE